MKWYNKYNRIEKTGSLYCPECNYQYLEEIMYFFSPLKCYQCKTKLFFMSTTLIVHHPYIYVINLETCPTIIKNMFNNLAKKNNIESQEELKELLIMISQKI